MIAEYTREYATLVCALAGVGSSLADAQRGIFGSACFGGEARRVWSLANSARLKASLDLRDEVPDEDRYRLSCIYAAQMLVDGWAP